MTRELSDSELAQRRYANWKHGARSEFSRTHDESLLDEADKLRLAELRRLVSTPEGCYAALVETAAVLGEICDWGMSALQQIASASGDARAFESSLMPTMMQALACHRRAVEALARLDTGGRR